MPTSLITSGPHLTRFLRPVRIHNPKVPNSITMGAAVFGATVCKTARPSPMLSDRALSVCPVCDVRALWPTGWTDQDET